MLYFKINTPFSKNPSPYEVSMHALNLANTENGQDKQVMNQKLIERLQKDPYLDEAYQVLIDWISINLSSLKEPVEYNRTK